MEVPPLSTSQQQNLSLVHHTPPLKMVGVATSLSIAALACLALVSFLFNPFDYSTQATAALYCTYTCLGGIAVVLVARYISMVREAKQLQNVKKNLSESVNNAQLQSDEIKRLKELAELFADKYIPEKDRKKEEEGYPIDRKILLEALLAYINQEEFQKNPLSYVDKTVDKKIPEFLRNAVLKIREPILAKAIESTLNKT